MVIFNRGDSEDNVRRMLQSRLRIPHSRSLIAQANEFNPMEKYLLERIIAAQGLSSRIRIEDIDNSGAVIRAGSRSAPLTREGVRQITEYVQKTGLRDYWEDGPNTRQSLRYTAARGYHKQITELMRPGLEDFAEQQFGRRDVTITREAVRPRSADVFRELYTNEAGEATGMMRSAGPSGMQVIRASVPGPNGEPIFFTEQQMRIASSTGPRGFFTYGDELAAPNSKAAKRYGPALFNQSQYSVTLDRKIKAGVVDAEKLFEGMARLQSSATRGTMSRANAELLRDNDLLRKRAVDGALVMNESLLDEAAKQYKAYIDDIQVQIDEILRSNDPFGRIEVESLRDQKRHLQGVMGNVRNIAERGGRFSNGRAMGIDPADLGILSPKLRDDFATYMAKGDIRVFGRVKVGGKKVSGYQEYAKLLQRIGKALGQDVPDFSDTDIIGFGSVGGDQRGLAFVKEIGGRVDGLDMSYLQFDPTEAFGGVRTNVENITGGNLLFRGRKGGVGDAYGVMRSGYQHVLDEATRTGSLPIGYMRDMVESLRRREDQLMGRAGHESELKRIRAAKSRATRLLQRAYSGETLRDPGLIREFAETMREGITRSGGKIDPVLTMPNSVFAHIAPDIVSNIRREAGQTFSESMQAIMERVADDHIAFSPTSGFVMNSVTAAKAYHAHGGFDWDDALEAHLRWSRNAAGEVQLYALATRMPMSLGEGGVYKVWGFDDQQSVDDIFDFLELGVEKEAGGEQAVREIRELRAIREEGERLRALKPEDVKKRAAVTRRLNRRLSKIWGEDAPDMIDRRLSEIGTYSNVEDAALHIEDRVNEFIQRHIMEQTDLAGNAFDHTKETGFEFSKRLFDRRLGNQVQYMEADDPLRVAYEAATSSKTEADRVKLLGVLADRGMLNSVKVPGGGSIYSGGIADRSSLRRVAADESLMEDILNYRVLKYDTMASYDHWLREFSKRGNRAADIFKSSSTTMFDSNMSVSERRNFKKLLDDFSATSPGTQGRTIAVRMLEEYRTELGNPGLLGRSVNINTVIDSMNSNLMAMKEAGLIDTKRLRDISAAVPYIDTETLIDMLVQGGANDNIIRQANKIYYGQVAGLATLMSHMDTIFQDIASTKSGTTVDQLTEQYGLSRELFNQRIGKSLFFRGSDAGNVFFQSLASEFGILDDQGEVVIPESMQQFEEMISGRSIFGKDEFGRLLGVREEVMSIIGGFEEETLSRAHRTIPELAPEIFTSKETEAAQYLQDVYEESYRSARAQLEELDRLGPWDVTKLHQAIEPSQIDELATGLAGRNVVRAFSENFAEYEDVVDEAGQTVKRMTEDSWRVLGALIKRGSNPRLVNSSTFSVLYGGTQAFFTRRRVNERLGPDATFSDFFADRFENATRETQEQLTRVAMEDFPSELQNPQAKAADSLRQMREAISQSMESSMGISPEELADLGITDPDLARDMRPPTFDATRAARGTTDDVMTDIGQRAHESAYGGRAVRDTFSRLMDIPMFRKGAIGAAGLIGFSFLYQATQKKEEDMLGDNLPGGGSYRSPMPSTQMDIARQYVPQAATGVTYNVNVRGGGPALIENIEALIGMSSGGSTYESLPRPGGSRAEFQQIESMFR